jgi:hypothetical protein
MGHLKHGVHVDAPAKKAWESVDDPHDWVWPEGVSGPDEVTGDGGARARVDFTVRTGVHVHRSWRSVNKRGDPDRGGFGRGESGCAWPGWATWDWKPENGGTRIPMEMASTVPSSVQGEFVDRLMFERLPERTMHRSLEDPT